MKVVNATRYEIYPLLKKCFTNIGIKPAIVEVGVCRGTNLEYLINSFRPASTFLVDQWIPYSPIKDAPIGSDIYNSESSYFGGPVDDPNTYEDLYNYCKNTFVKNPNTTIIRESSLEAAQELHRLNVTLDFIYIDAGHLYAEVLQDLVSYEKLLSENGVIMLDDFVNSDEVKKQNIEVVQAVNDFLKNNAQYRPSLITKSTVEAWSNILITKKEAPINSLIEKELMESNLFFVDIPDEILGLVESNPYKNSLSFNKKINSLSLKE